MFGHLRWFRLLAVAVGGTVGGVLALSTQAVASGKAVVGHSASPRYALVDVGTFGGPKAFINLPGVPITSRGAVLGTADTTIADEDFPNFNPFIVGSIELAGPPRPTVTGWRG